MVTYRTQRPVGPEKMVLPLQQKYAMMRDVKKTLLASLEKVAADMEDDLRLRVELQERELIDPDGRKVLRPWPKETRSYRKCETPRERRRTPQLMARPAKTTSLKAWSTSTLELFGALLTTG